MYNKNAYKTLTALFLLFCVALGYAAEEQGHELKQIVIDKYRENVKSIVCGSIQWEKRQIRNGFGGIKIKDELHSEYKMV